MIGCQVEGLNWSILLRALSRHCVLSNFKTPNIGEGLILCCSMIGAGVRGKVGIGSDLQLTSRAAAKEPGR